MKEKALRRLAEKLNGAGVTWAVGASWMLTKRGVMSEYHDFDLMIAPQDADTADHLLSGLGMKSAKEPAHPGAFRGEYHFDGADIDVTAGMTIPRQDGVWHIRFDAASIDETVTVLGAQVPMMYLEDWLVLYALFGRESRVKAITDYFAVNGVKHPQRFSQVCEEPLPGDVLAKINALLEADKA